jgi:hypothetical protein
MNDAHEKMPLNKRSHAELSRYKQQLETQVSAINRALRVRLPNHEARRLKGDKQRLLLDIAAVESAILDLRVINGGQDTAPAWLLLMQWDERWFYFATRENLTEMTIDMLVEIGPDAPCVMAQTRLTEAQAERLPAWVWLLPTEREDLDFDDADPEGDDE